MAFDHDRGVVAAMVGRLRDTAARALDGFPVYADPETAAWTTAPDGFWTGGFWTGSLWLAFHATGEMELRRDASSWTARLEPRANSETVLRGLLFWYGAGVGSQLTADPETARIALAGARGLADSYRPAAQLIPLGNAFGEDAGSSELKTNIDGVAGTAALLGWASDRTHDSFFRDIAAAHVQRHRELCVRADGSVSQAASVDPRTGAALRHYTQKGLSDASTWSRGQAWAMLAFAQATRWLSSDFSDVAVQVANWWIDHLPPSNVAAWDFDDPAHDKAKRDTSATAIAASALLKLAVLTPQHAPRYKPAAEKMVEALVDHHLTPVDAQDARPAGMLLDGCYNHQTSWADAHELVWGDYFLLEAFLALTDRLDPTEV